MKKEDKVFQIWEWEEIILCCLDSLEARQITQEPSSGLIGETVGKILLVMSLSPVHVGETQKS